MAKFKEATKDVSAEDAIAEAMGAAAVSSGANALPPAGEVPVAWSHGVAVASPQPYQFGDQTIEQIGLESELMNNPNTPEYIKAMASQTAKALAERAPAPPPAQVAFGGTTYLVPASVRTVPDRLHRTNSRQAKALWDAFLGDQKKQMAMMAAGAGFSQTPFVWLAQQLICQINMFGFQPVKQEGAGKEKIVYKDFHSSQKDPNGPIYRGLETWAGPDLARALVTICENKNVSILDGLAQMYRALDEKRAAELKHAQQVGTAQEWAE